MTSSTDSFATPSTEQEASETSRTDDVGSLTTDQAEDSEQGETSAATLLPDRAPSDDQLSTVEGIIALCLINSEVAVGVTTTLLYNDVCTAMVMVFVSVLINLLCVGGFMLAGVIDPPKCSMCLRGLPLLSAVFLMAATLAMIRLEQTTTLTVDIFVNASYVEVSGTHRYSRGEHATGAFIANYVLRTLALVTSWFMMAVVLFANDARSRSNNERVNSAA